MQTPTESAYSRSRIGLACGRAASGTPASIATGTDSLGDPVTTPERERARRQQRRRAVFVWPGLV
jgi:hypothetical protein